MKRIAALAAGALACALAIAGERLDDSLSPQSRITVSARYLHEDTSGIDQLSFHAVLAEARNVEVRLNTAKYLGRRAEIYLVLPLAARGLSSPGALRLEWRAQGRFAAPSGSLQAGGRALLFRGTVAQAQLTEIFDFRFHVDERHMRGPLEFEPQFEIELVP